MNKLPHFPAKYNAAAAGASLAFFVLMLIDGHLILATLNGFAAWFNWSIVE